MSRRVFVGLSLLSLGLGLWWLAPWGAAKWPKWGAPSVAQITPEVDSPTPQPGPLSGFVLMGQDGQSFDARSLRGKTVLLNFVFTACSSTCPGTTQALKALQQRLADAGEQHIELVSISVDPLNDTPERLRQFAQAQGVSLKNWHWLTGRPEEISRLLDRYIPPRAGQRKPEDHISDLYLIDAFGRPIGRLQGVPVDDARTWRELTELDHTLGVRARRALL